MKPLEQQIYDLVPKLECKGLCIESCGPIDMSEREYKIVEEFCKKNNIPFHRFEKATPLKVLKDLEKSDQDLMCPYLKDNKCSIYDVRPLICRLWGNVESMTCMFGCKPKKLMDDKTAHSLLDRMDVLQ